MDADGVIQWSFFMPFTFNTEKVTNLKDYDSYNSIYSIYPGDEHIAKVMQDYSAAVERKR